ncbi:MAG TPA: GNAT family protein [Pyrinomonadaceae bacterium]|jgi:RimJ/RimL family protein N-acetyltransferase
MKTELTDGNILIRPFRDDDIDVVHGAVCESLDELGRWLQWCHPGYAREETAAFILARAGAWSAGQEFSFAIVDARTGEFLGSVGLNQLNPAYRMANLGYWVRTIHTARGVASAATRLVARFGLLEVGLKRLEIIAAVGNRASQRAAEKAGAVREGVLRKRLWINEQPHDAVLYSLVAEDLEA